MQIVPIFPLPNVVFFPQAILPLHIFEPRYREMIRDAMAGEGRIAMVLPQPGWEEEYQDNPAVHDIGTIGRITDLETLPDGRYNLKLVGEQRVSLFELPSDRAYRQCRFEARPENTVDNDDPELRSAKLDLLATHAWILQQLSDEPSQGLVLDDSLSFAAAVNRCCMTLPVETSVRQELLEEDDLRERQRWATSIARQVLEKISSLTELTEGTGRDGLEIN